MSVVASPAAGGGATCQYVIDEVDIGVGNMPRCCEEPAVARFEAKRGALSFTIVLCNDHAHELYPHEYADLCRRMSVD